MHYAAAALLLGGLVAAVPVANPAEEPCVSQILCIDGLSPCGVRWGGCYDVCDKAARPVAPPCPTTKVPLPTTTKKPTPTTTKKATTTKKPTPTTSKKPTPTTTKKPAPTTTTKKPTITTKPTPTTVPITKITTKVTTLKPVPSTSKKPTPTTTKKPTPTTTKKPTPTITTTKKPVPTTIKTITSRTSASTKCSATNRVCYDAINSCGMTYGGCFPDCKPWPTFTPPPCPTVTSLSTQITDVITRITTLPTLTVG